jgi:hypothetical protein
MFPPARDRDAARNKSDTPGAYTGPMKLLLLLALSAFAAEPSHEDKLRSLLAEKRASPAAGVIETGELRDAVAAQGTQAGKKRLMTRLPGMAADPFSICRDLARCAEAPVALHVEDENLVADAVLALARPWFNLQRAKGRRVDISASEDGASYRLALEGIIETAVTVDVQNVPTGGFEASLRGGAETAALYARERASLKL